MSNFDYKIGNDFEKFSKGEVNNSINNKIEFIMIKGKKLEVFSTIDLNNKIYIITRENDNTGEVKFDIFVKNRNEYIQPKKGTDKIYDYYKKIIETKVYSDSIISEEYNPIKNLESEERY